MDKTKHIIESYGPNGRIALFCGWAFDNYATHPWISPNGTGFRYPPEYNRDLNQMHEAEEHLQSHHLCYEYNNILYNILGNTVGNRADKPHHWTWHATAKQRAEAFLKTIGKWEDDSICFNSMDWKCKDEI
jgi:hypothetical protein